MEDLIRKPAHLPEPSRHGVFPLDEHNVELLAQVHPPDWINPEPSGRYNMVVIGAGTGGLVTAAAVAGLGGKVALVEEALMGGDCLNFGCVPSKALLRSARAAADTRRAADFGIVIDGDVRVDFGAVMRRVRELRARISQHDSAERFVEELGVEVFLGRGQFTGSHTVRVGNRELTFARACIATGARPAVPAIDGLEMVPYLTSETLFNLTELPPRLAIVGAGAVGCEMAQAFARFGSRVTLFERASRVLPAEDEAPARVVQEALVDDDVELVLDANIEQIERDSVRSTEVLRVYADGVPHEVDALLIATGRTPNVEGLGLESAGVDYDRTDGVEVDSRLRTSNSHVFAVGDVATARHRFTHTADAMARMVVRNALFFGRETFDDLHVPSCTYTDPEVARIGARQKELDSRGVDYDTFTQRFDQVDRGVVEGATKGFARFLVEAGTDEILGATIVGAHAGELISEVAVAMHAGLGLGDLANVIHPYPTLSEAIRQCGDAYNRTRLTPFVGGVLRKLLSVRR